MALRALVGAVNRVQAGLTVGSVWTRPGQPLWAVVLRDPADPRRYRLSTFGGAGTGFLQGCALESREELVVQLLLLFGPEIQPADPSVLDEMARRWTPPSLGRPPVRARSSRADSG